MRRGDHPRRGHAGHLRESTERQTRGDRSQLWRVHPHGGGYGRHQGHDQFDACGRRRISGNQCRRREEPLRARLRVQAHVVPRGHGRRLYQNDRRGGRGLRHQGNVRPQNARRQLALRRQRRGDGAANPAEVAQRRRQHAYRPLLSRQPTEIRGRHLPHRRERRPQDTHSRLRQAPHSHAQGGRIQLVEDGTALDEHWLRNANTAHHDRQLLQRHSQQRQTAQAAPRESHHEERRGHQGISRGSAARTHGQRRSSEEHTGMPGKRGERGTGQKGRFEVFPHLGQNRYGTGVDQGRLHVAVSRVVRRLFPLREAPLLLHRLHSEGCTRLGWRHVCPRLQAGGRNGDGAAPP